MREAAERIEQALRDLEVHYGDTLAWEQKASRRLSDEAFEREKRLIQAKRSWIRDQQADKQSGLENLERMVIDEEAIARMTTTLNSNLESLTEEQWRSVLETLKVKVFAFSHGEWDIQIMVPALSIVNTTVRNPPLPAKTSPQSTRFNIF